MCVYIYIYIQVIHICIHIYIYIGCTNNVVKLLSPKERQGSRPSPAVLSKPWRPRGAPTRRDSQTARLKQTYARDNERERERDRQRERERKREREREREIYIYTREKESWGFRVQACSLSRCPDLNLGLGPQVFRYDFVRHLLDCALHGHV